MNALIHRSEILFSNKHEADLRSQAIKIVISNRNEETYIRPSKHYKGFHYNNQLSILYVYHLFPIYLRVNYIIYWKKLHINAKVVAIPPTNLRQLFMLRRICDIKCNRYNCYICVDKDRLCQVKGCVYRICCDECRPNGFHISETMQPLYLRYAQHLGDMRHPQKQRPWSEHIKIHHNWTIGLSKTSRVVNNTFRK